MKKIRSARYVALSVFFLVACLIFVAKMVNLQIISKDKYAPSSNESSERIYIEAVRGNICDRNGKILVKDERLYKFILDYDTIPDTSRELNRVLLTALNVMDESGQEYSSEWLTPFKGTYPNFEFADDFTTNMDKYDEFIRLIEKNYVTEKYTLEMAMRDLDATAVARYYARKYKVVDETTADGGEFDYESEFTDEEITRLIYLRYEMDRQGFGGSKDFVFIGDASYAFNVYVKELAVDGLMIEETVKRTYQYPGYASHILGLVGQIYAEDWDEYKDKGYDIDATVGISGCEAIFEDYLRGIDGIVDIYRDANGNVTRREVVREPIAGKDVWLTIDIDVQIAAEDGLEQNIKDIVANSFSTYRGEDANAGAAVAIDPNNGELLAIASYPSFDLNTYNRDYSKLSADENAPLLNRALQATLAPGSTFKVGMALAALEEGVYSPTDNMICHGYYDRYGHTNAFKCAVHPMSQVGTSLNVSEAIRISCNCFFYESGHLLGIDTMNKWCRYYGLGLPTGIELYEKTGILAGREFREANPQFCIDNELGAWQTGDTWQAAIGQSENAFTPLQVSVYIATVINGGTRYAAHLLHSVHEYGESSEVYLFNEAKILSQISPMEKNVTLIKEAMRKVITSDRASIYLNFRDVAYSVGAKTGTAQAGSTASDNAWFTAFAPVEDPRIAVTCMIEHGASGSYASYTARQIMDAYLDK